MDDELALRLMEEAFADLNPDDWGDIDPPADAECFDYEDLPLTRENGEMIAWTPSPHPYRYCPGPSGGFAPIDRAEFDRLRASYGRMVASTVLTPPREPADSLGNQVESATPSCLSRGVFRR